MTFQILLFICILMLSSSHQAADFVNLLSKYDSVWLGGMMIKSMPISVQSLLFYAHKQNVVSYQCGGINLIKVWSALDWLIMFLIKMRAYRYHIVQKQSVILDIVSR